MECLPDVEGSLATALLQDADSYQIHDAALSSGLCSLNQQAEELVAQGHIDRSELMRQLRLKESMAK